MTASNSPTSPEMRPVSNGDFCWFEVYSRDLKGSCEFYSRLFGWRTKPHEVPDYQIFHVGDERVGGAMKIGADWPAEVPAHWMLYAKVESTERACERVKQTGGKVCVGPLPIPKLGTFAILDDPVGGSLAVFAGDQDERPDGLSSFCWTELSTTDLSKAAPFYEAVLGWRAMKLPGTSIDLLTSGGRPVASVERVTEAPRPGWMPYVQVADAGAGCALARELGARVDKGPVELPAGMGRYAWLRDPQGARFGVYQAG